MTGPSAAVLRLPFERAGSAPGEWSEETFPLRTPADDLPGAPAGVPDRLVALVQALLYRYTRQAEITVVAGGAARTVRVDGATPAGDLAVLQASLQASLQAFLQPEPAGARWSSVHVGTAGPVPDRPDCTLRLAFAVAGGQVTCRASYRADRLTGTEVRRLAGHLDELAASGSADPTCRIADLDLLGPAEWEAALAAGAGAAAGTHTDVPDVPGLVAAAARCAPHAPAVTFGPHTRTYAELDGDAARWAAALRASGVRPGDVVGVCLDRSVEMLAAVLGVLRCAATYLPLDPAYPVDRLRYMLADSGAAVVAADPAGRALVAGLGADVATVLPPDPAHDAGDQPEPVPPELPAFVIYTSGSTGRPKGVAVPHRAVANFILGMAEQVGVTSEDVVLAQAPLSFDISVFELLMPLAAGARIHLVDRATATDGAALGAAVEAGGVTVVQGTATTHRMLLAAGWRPGPHHRVVSGGEPLPPDVCAAVLAGGAGMFNSYGPTETTVYTHSLAMEPGRPVVLGGPLRNVRTYLLDEDLQPVPVGVPGEICLAGDCLAGGYLHRPDLTAERFLPDPFAPGQRLYRSGDLARWTEDGRMESLGRIDQQVKLRGHRIELGEIEAVLRRDPRVGGAMVALRTDGAEPMLVAYVELAGGDPPDRDELRAALAASLPAYMVPARFVAVPALPLTPSGKLDRNATPPGGRALRGAERAAPATPMQRALVGVWLDLLGIEHLGVDEPVFDAGATSLTLMRAAETLEEVFRVPVPVRALFEAPTVAAQAEYLRDHRDTPPEPAVQPETPAPPVTRGQEQVWFFDTMTPGTAVSNIVLRAEITGPLDVAALRGALAAIVARHEPLRTTFTAHDGRPVPGPAACAEEPLSEHDLSATPEGDRSGAEDRLVLDVAGRPFDLATGPLWRAALVRRAEHDHLLVLVMHHIATDGYSLLVLQRELVAGYEALAGGGQPAFAPLPRTYPELARDSRRRAAAPGAGAHLEYWTSALDALPDPVSWRFGRDRPVESTYAGDAVALTIPGELVGAVHRLAAAERCSPFMVLLAGFAALVRRHTGSTDLVVGTPTAGRPPGADDVVGYFVNMLPLRLRMPADPTTRDLLGTVRELTLDAYTHRDTPFLDVVEAVQPERRPGVQPVFQMVFTTPPQLGRIEAAGTAFGFDEGHSGQSLYDLEVHLPEPAAGHPARGFLKYRTELFDARHVRALADQYVRLLAEMVAAPGRHLSTVPLLAAEEREQVTVGWNATDRAYPRDATLDDLVEQCAERTPDAPAVECGRIRLTYRELDERANQFAHRLRAMGVRPDSRVALCMPASADWVACALGVLKAGAGYVPLDPAYPRDRLTAMAAGVAAAVVVVNDAGRAGLPDVSADRLLSLAGSRAALAAEPVTRPPRTATPDSLAYVMFTSGSTGRPKGVAVTHRNVIRLVRDTNYVEFGPGDTVAQGSSLSFDAATFEVWGALTNGARLVGLPKEALLDPVQLEHRLRESGVDVLFLTTSLAMQVAREAPEALRSVRYFVFGGEQPDAHAIRTLLAHGGPARVVNGYGPTETTTFAATYECGELATAAPRTIVPMGRPIANTRLYVLDDALEPVVPGTVGELYVGGDGVARGYWNDPALTADRFVPDHLGGRPGARLYRTGDLARHRTDGTVEYLGRTDRQVKIRGFRIEPGEVEDCLHRSGLVRHAAVRVRPVGTGDPALVGYVVPVEPGAPLDPVWAFLRAELPDYLVPSALVAIPELPLTENGKLDAAALPDPPDPGSVAREAAQRPGSATERRVAEVWREILGVAAIGRHDNFFDLGGHSLKVAQATSRTAAVLGVAVPLRTLFERPTVAGFAASVDLLLAEGAGPQIVAGGQAPRDINDLLDEIDQR